MQCALVVVVNLYNNIAFYILLLIPRKTTLCIATATTKTTSSEKVKFEHLKKNNKKKATTKRQAEGTNTNVPTYICTWRNTQERRCARHRKREMCLLINAVAARSYQAASVWWV